MRVIPCVGAVILDSSGRLLLIQRGHAPGKGLWSIPGGRVEDGESDADAVAREVLEETGLVVTVGTLIGSVRRPAGVPDAEFDIRDYAAEVTGGTLSPGDDADGALWAGPGDLETLPLTEGLLETLRDWSALPGFPANRGGGGAAGATGRRPGPG